MASSLVLFCFFFFNDTPTTEIYTLSLHDALPISAWRHSAFALYYMNARRLLAVNVRGCPGQTERGRNADRSEEHTSELQSQSNLVCRLLLEKKNNTPTKILLLPTTPRRAEPLHRS